MHVFMYAGSVIVALVGFLIFAGAKGAIHEIEAGICFLISAILFSGASTRSGLQRVLGKVEALRIDAWPSRRRPPAEVGEQNLAADPVEVESLAPIDEVIQEPAAPKVASWVEEARAEMQKKRAPQELV